jgi:hypothetical protein
MKTFQTSGRFLSFVLFSCIVFSSCQNKLTTTNDFLIKVDSIHFPDTVPTFTQFNIEFFGIIGFNGCVKFKSFMSSTNDNRITISAWGTFDDKAGTCPDMLVSLDGIKFNTTFTSPGTYLIIVQEPDNSSLVVQIIAV